MKAIPRRTLFWSVALGLVTAAAAWWLLLPTPRQTLRFAEAQSGLTFSRDFRFLACSAGKHTSKRTWEGHLHVWDVAERQRLFSIPDSKIFLPGEVHSVQFLGNHKLAVCDNHSIRFWELPDGREWRPPEGRAAPVPDRDFHGRELVPGSDGTLYLLTRQPGRITVHDVESGKLQSERRFEEPGGYFNEFFPGGIITFERETYHMRSVPALDVAAKFARGQTKFTHYWAVSPDLKTIARVLGPELYIWRPAGEKTKEFPGSQLQFPSLSADGKHFAALAHNPSSLPGWLVSIGDRLGLNLGASGSGVIVVDLESDAQTASFKGASYGRFSPDGRSLAVVYEESVDLYDVPLGTPWGRIALAAVIAASVPIVFSTARRLLAKKRKPACKSVRTIRNDLAVPQ
ncbi:MAG: WD40 repeat domain-containing protein [Gemmataceae bacterium]|nr:WD40 repeat domain-containing protein [Gemmataceae bacterium]MCI0743570.1 WD40 repeat domain-containing protein [Gemmataceae bacterium]